MPIRKNSFANRVRQALIQIGPGGVAVTNDAIAEALDLVGDQDKKPMYTALRDMVRTGEAERVAPGVHAYRGRPDRKPEMRGAMWSVLRMRRIVSIEDLQELTGASADYAKEFLRLLIRRRVVEHIPRKGAADQYRLIQDPGPDTPANDEKAARLRRIREAKKAALAKIDDAGEACIAAGQVISQASRALISASQLLAAARIAVNDMPEQEVDHANE